MASSTSRSAGWSRPGSPANPVGWLLFGSRAVPGPDVGHLRLRRAHAGPSAPAEGPRPALAAAWVTSWSWSPAAARRPGAAVPAVPDGRPSARAGTARWRWGSLVLRSARPGRGSALAEGALTNSPRPAVANPLGLLPRAAGERSPPPGFVIGVLAAGARRLVGRRAALRRARGVERLQLKWLMWSASPAPPLPRRWASSRLLLDRRCRWPRLAELGLVRVPDRGPARGRHRDPALPALRHRRGHQPDVGLRDPHGHARRVVPRLGAGAALHARPAHQRLRPGGRGVDPGGRRAVPPAADPDPVRSSTAASTAPATTRSAPSTRSPPTCATSSTSSHCSATCAPWCSTPCTRPRVSLWLRESAR